MTGFHANTANASGVRDPVDRYETPDSVTRALMRRVDLPDSIREPACGTGRITRVLEDALHTVVASDIVEHGIDFTQESNSRGCEGLVTNPPYRDGLALAFARKALELYDGPVCLLMRLGFLSSQARAEFFLKNRPSGIIVISRRILFFKATGERISGQAHDHCWIVWNAELRHSLDFVPADELDDTS